MKKYSRFLAAALTLAMLAGLTVPASAEEASPFAKVDGTEVSDLAVLKELVEAATEPVEIEMLKDVELPEGLYFGVPEGKTVVLDMAGMNITVASGYEGRPLVNRGTLTVLGDGTIDSSASRLGGYGAIDNYGTLTVENGTFVGSLYANGASLKNRPGAEATIEGGTFEGATCAVYNDGKMTVDGGTFSSEACNQLKEGGEELFSYAFRNYGELYFNDGEVTGVHGGLAIGGGYAEVKDGTFTARLDGHGAKCTFYALYIAGEVDEVEAHNEGGTCVSEGRVALLAGNDNTGGDGGINAKATAYISGGSFTGVGGAMSAGKNTGAPSITGGTFNSDISDYLAQGYTCVQDGQDYTVTGPVASIGGQRYETLAKAIAAVPDGTAEPVTVTLLSDAIGGVKIGSNKNMVLDLGGYALSVDKGVGSTGTETNGIQLLRGSTVTIENGTLKVGKAADINFMIKNYCDLTLRDVVIDGTGMVANGNPAVNNCGQLTLAGDGNVIKNVPQGNYGIATGNYHYQEAIHTVIEGGKIDSVYTEGNAWISSPHEYDGELVKTEIKGGEIGAVGMYTWGDTKPLNWQFVISDAATVEENHFAAKAGTGYYATLADAVAAAEDGGTVTLLNDVSVSSPIAIRKDLTIDGGGHTLTGVTGGSGGSRQGMFHLDNTERAVTFTLKDAELINKKSWSSPSGISVQASDQTVHLDKVTMDTAY